MIFVTAALFVVLGLTALLHVYWGVGGLWPARDTKELARMVVGVSRFPPPPACIGVAISIAVTAVWPLLLAGVIAVPLPGRAIFWVAAGIALVFLGRGAAGYVPAWARHHPLEPFARLDRQVYSPLCLMIGVCYVFLLWRSPA